MGKKDITINELAGMVKTGFDEMGKQFGKVDKRFERIENRLTAVEQRLESMDLRLGQFTFNIDVLEVKRKMEVLERYCYARK
jgi:hypothetical protein